MKPSCSSPDSGFHHLNGVAATLGHTEATCIALAVIEKDFAAERLILVLYVIDRARGTGFDRLTEVSLHRAESGYQTWFHDLILVE
jgi:hypothetical protein